VVDKLLSKHEKLLASSQSYFNSTFVILKSLDKLASILARSLTKEDSILLVRERNVALVVAYIRPNNLSIIATESHDQYLNIGINSVITNQSKILASFATNNNTFNTTYYNPMFSFLFRNSHLFQQREKSSSKKKSTTRKDFVETSILAVTFIQEPSLIMNETIELNFQKTKYPDVHKEITRKCSFWAPTIGQK